MPETLNSTTTVLQLALFSDTPLVENSFTCTIFFVGILTQYCEIFGMTSKAQFINTLMDVVCCSGTMDNLLSNCAQGEV